MGSSLGREDRLGQADVKPIDDEAPESLWEAVAEGRRLSRGVTAALGIQDEEAALAERNSLIAEGSAWKDPSGKRTHSERARSFASGAAEVAERVFGRVKLSAQPVTLAGSRGKVPVTIANSSEKPMTVRVITKPSGAMKAGLFDPLNITLQPQDNFIEVPVDLQGALSGRLDVVVQAADVEVARTTVRLSASVMDRLVILSGLIVLLGGLLAFIIVRVRRAEASRNGASVGR